jgi:hypothetical protein
MPCGSNGMAHAPTYRMKITIRRTDGAPNAFEIYMRGRGSHGLSSERLPTVQAEETFPPIPSSFFFWIKITP